MYQKRRIMPALPTVEILGEDANLSVSPEPGIIGGKGGKGTPVK
jgi:hypothetical protein